MKVKLLIPPLLITIIIAVLVWLVYPAWSNGVNGVKEEREAYAKEKGKLDALNAKSDNIKKLSSALSADSSERDVILKYLPESIKEEEIIDNLNYLASGEGISLFNLSVSQPEKKTAEDVGQLTSADTGIGQFNPDGTASLDVAPPKRVPDPQKFDVKISAIGAYDKIKSFLGKVYALERFNKFSSLEVKKIVTEDKKDTTDNLQVDAVLNFAMLKKLASVSSLEEDVLTKGSFDVQAVTDIRNSKNVDMLKLNVDQTGKTNPFLP